MIRSASLVLAGFALLSCASPASAEVNYPWCIITGGREEGVMSCGFVSLAQCQQTRIATDMCVQNPLYRGPDPQPAGKRRTAPRRQG